MHGLGNDFVIVDARETPLEMTAAKAAAIANRQSGIGCDQLIILRPSSKADTLNMPVGWEELHNPASVNVGNPHVIFFVDDSENVELDRLGPMIEVDPLFPEKVNVNIAHIEDGAIHLRVWERGVGLTRACGTGACATAVAGIRRGLASSPVQVNLPGGSLMISWTAGESIQMEGPTTYVYSGEADWDHFGLQLRR